MDLSNNLVIFYPKMFMAMIACVTHSCTLFRFFKIVTRSAFLVLLFAILITLNGNTLEKKLFVLFLYFYKKSYVYILLS